jgi:hypothetical protein
VGDIYIGSFAGEVALTGETVTTAEAGGAGKRKRPVIPPLLQEAQARDIGHVTLFPEVSSS